MKLITLTICTALLFFVSCSDDKTKSDKKIEKGGTTEVKEESKTEPYTMPDSATMMKNWQAYMTPGKEHEMLAKSVGVWNSEVTWREYPGGPEQKSTGTTTNKMIMGGRYQVSNHSGNMMGMPFEGMSTTAFDNQKKVFINTWIDNMGTGVMIMEGPWDEATQSITLKGKMVDPAMGKEIEMKEVLKIVDDNTHMFEMYKPGMDGKEFRCMEIKYTRKK
jgi:hypothetical protein